MTEQAFLLKEIKEEHILPVGSDNQAQSHFQLNWVQLLTKCGLD